MPDRITIPVTDDYGLQVIYEITAGDMLIGTLIACIGMYLLIRDVVKNLWR